VEAVLRALAFFGAIAIAIFAGEARADEFEDFANAKNAYEAGQYQTAVTRFEALRAANPKNKGLAEETNKLLAVSYLFLGNKTEAEKSFIEILTDDPDFALDPLIFPIDVIDFFSEVKARHAERLAALSAARAAEEEARRKAEEERLRIQTEKLKRNVYINREVQRRSVLVALMPFGAGQFQNGHKVKGALFLTGEILLAAGSITTFILHERLRPAASEPIDSSSELSKYEQMEKGYRIANTACATALGVTAIAGIIDSLFYFHKETVTWKRLDEREVPPALKPKPIAAVAPFGAPGGVGIAAVGRF
jgi:tetratricopeptide (TPR) repeat protein